MNKKKLAILIASISGIATVLVGSFLDDLIIPSLKHKRANQDNINLHATFSDQTISSYVINESDETIDLVEARISLEISKNETTLGSHPSVSVIYHLSDNSIIRNSSEDPTKITFETNILNTIKPDERDLFEFRIENLDDIVGGHMELDLSNGTKISSKIR